MARFFPNEGSNSIPVNRRVSELTDAPVHFGLVPADHWNQPSWIDETKASDARKTMEQNGVIYGGRLFIQFFMCSGLICNSILGSLPCVT